MELIKKLAPGWYQPEGTDAEFEITPLSGLQMMGVLAPGGVEIEPGGGVVLHARAMQAALVGVTGWRNVCEEGAAIPFSRVALDRLPAGMLIQLAVQVINRSQLDGEAEKNC